jgi:hypothetical protein
MDIQGAEMSALLGARRVLAENSSVQLLLEYWPFGLTRAGVAPLQLVELLAKLGFSVEAVGWPGKRPEEIGPREGDYCNLYARRHHISSKQSKT